MKLLFSIAGLVCALSAVGPATAEAASPESGPKYTASIDDQAAVLKPAERKEIEEGIQRFAQQNSANFNAVILKTKPAAGLSAYAAELFEKKTPWGIARDRSFLLVIVESPTEAKFVIGDSISDRIPPVIADFALEKAVLPRLERDDWSGAILSATDLLTHNLTRRRAVSLGEPPEPFLPLERNILFLVLLTLFAGFGVDRALEIALGNFVSAFFAAIFTLGIGAGFAPLGYAICAAVAAFFISYMDVFGGHEPVTSVRRTPDKSSARINTFYQRRH